jgi:NADH/NAD ratio-sensing transcriptional regulator Rex
MTEELVVIPKATISRLPLYFRALTEYYHLDIALVSSEEIALISGVWGFEERGMMFHIF